MGAGWLGLSLGSRDRKVRIAGQGLQARAADAHTISCLRRLQPGTAGSGRRRLKVQPWDNLWC